MLETDRFIAKLPTPEDIDNWTKLFTDPEVMQFIRKKTNTAAEVRAKYLDPSIKHAEKYGFSSCSIFAKDTGEFVGCVGIFHYGFDDTQPDIEIGYFLHKKYWGKGCAQELAQGFIDWGFQHLAISKLIADANPANERSWRVMEKLGMQYVGNILNPDKHEMLLYEIYKN
ncbi:MAG: GNAT family N-acetyltransferase [Pseudomonadota bacterium]